MERFDFEMLTYWVTNANRPLPFRSFTKIHVIGDFMKISATHLEVI